MTISHEYAEELGRQIDELEEELDRLRNLIPTEPQIVWRPISLRRKARRRFGSESPTSTSTVMLTDKQG